MRIEFNKKNDGNYEITFNGNIVECEVVVNALGNVVGDDARTIEGAVSFLRKKLNEHRTKR